MNKRNRKRIGLLLLLFFFIGNFIVYNQAYRFTHFSEVKKGKTKRPEELSVTEKLSTLFLGINIPKPINETQPIREYKRVTLKSYEELEAWSVKIPNDKGTVIMFHGYSSSKSGLLAYSEEFNNKGYSTLGRI